MTARLHHISGLAASEAGTHGDAIAEELVAGPAAGVIAFWSMTGWSLNNLAEHLNQAFFTVLFGGEAERLGDATLEALQAYGAKGYDPFMLDISVLIGDPALKVR